MAELLRRLGCTVDYDAEAADRRHRRPGRARAPGRLRPGPPDARLDLRPRSAARPLRRGPRSRCPAATRSARRPLDLHVAGLTKLGAELDSEHGYIVASAPQGLDRGDRLARLPERRRHRERADGRGARQRHDRHRQRGARAGDRRPRARCSQQMGAKIDGIGTSTLTIEGVDRLLADRATRSCRTGSSPAPGRSPPR